MASSVRARLSRETLVWARKASGYEPAEVARSAGVSAERYQGWEAGDDQPTFRQLRQIANKLKRPLALFYLSKPPPEPVPPPDFRVLPGRETSDYSPELRLELRKADRMLLLVASFRQELGLPEPVTIPRAFERDDPEVIGESLRAFLGISIEQQIEPGDPSVVYRLLRDAVFARGILAAQFGVDRDQALGFALWHDFAPLVAVNTRQAPEAKTFTLLHELAHVALRMPGVSDAAIPFQQVADGPRAAIETFCNRVAAATLLPSDSDAVQQALDRISNAGLDRDIVRSQARRLGVSKYALAFRLSTVRSDLSAAVQNSVKSWLAVDKRVKPPATRPSKGGPPPALLALGRKGRGFSRHVLLALRESRLSIDDARELLDLEPHHFSRLEEYVFRAPAEEGDEG